MSLKARKWSGSLSAMTPSKSKTMAFSIASALGFPDALAGMNRQLEAILGWRIGTFPCRVVVAVRMVGPVEINLVDPGRVALEIHEAAGRVRFGAAREIAKGH